MIAATMPKTPQRAGHGGALKLHRDCGFGEVSIAAHHSAKPEKPPFPETGTAPAISYLTSGVAALSACSTGRGGARNRADRESLELTQAQIANLKAAKGHADKIGLPFTRMISIHWEGAGVPLEGMVKATGRFTDLLTKMLARHGSGSAWLWSHENVPGRGHDKGGHCHLLAHVPPHLVPRLLALQRGWLRKITRQPYRARVILSKPIGGRLGLEAGNPDLHAMNLEVAFGYVCKGAPQAVLDRFEIDRQHEPSGRVIGRRCSASQNINAKARKTWAAP